NGNKLPVGAACITGEYGQSVNKRSHTASYTKTESAASAYLWFLIQNIYSGSLFKYTCNVHCIAVFNECGLQHFHRNGNIFQPLLIFGSRNYHHIQVFGVGIEINISGDDFS